MVSSAQDPYTRYIRDTRLALEQVYHSASTRQNGPLDVISAWDMAAREKRPIAIKS